MNRIEAIRAPSKFVTEPHLAIVVDGISLDVALGVEGLVSAFLGWFHDEEDSEIPWQRILPDVGCTGDAPLLICPDDLDFICTTVMAEVVAEPDVIRWDRLGYNASPQGNVGSWIRWESNWGPYRFSRAEYEECLAKPRTVRSASSRWRFGMLLPAWIAGTIQRRSSTLAPAGTRMRSIGSLASCPWCSVTSAGSTSAHTIRPGSGCRGERASGSEPETGSSFAAFLRRSRATSAAPRAGIDCRSSSLFSSREHFTGRRENGFGRSDSERIEQERTEETEENRERVGRFPPSLCSSVSSVLSCVIKVFKHLTTYTIWY